ncbi:MAG: molybdopterin-dependent oxidoreductase, partial [Acidimicrobiia bacterium]
MTTSTSPLRSPSRGSEAGGASGRRGVGPFRDGAFSSALHDERLAAHLGAALGVAFSVCFVTGLISHAIQEPPGWFTWGSRPVNAYRITQGLHVITGIASIPLLLAKLWVVYPKLFTRPLVQGAAHAVERLALIPLISGSLFLLTTGVINIAYWYSAFPFFFPAAHLWAAWITIGALVVHIGAKTTATADAFTRRSTKTRPAADGLNRRGFLGTVGATAGVLTLAVAGQTIEPLRRLAVLAPRRPKVGPQGVPVNKAAAQVGVTEAARDPAYRLSVKGKVATPVSFSLAELATLPQHEADLPITCVEGWSASARWRGVRVRDLLARAGAAEDSEVRVESLEE